MPGQAAHRAAPLWRSADPRDDNPLPRRRLLRAVTSHEIITDIGDFTFERTDTQCTFRFRVPYHWIVDIDPASLQPMCFCYREEFGACYCAQPLHYMEQRGNIRLAADRLIVAIPLTDLKPVHLPMGRGTAELCIGHVAVRFNELGRRIRYGASAI